VAAIYGVTRQAPGVSKRGPVDFRGTTSGAARGRLGR
jgi:hypothetical protein